MKVEVAAFKRSLDIQLRVVGALIMREIITRYGRHNLGFMWLFLEPMIFTLGVTTLWTVLKATHSSQLPIVAFAVTGYSSLLLWRNAANRCGQAIEANAALLFHRNVKILDLFIARLVLEIAGATISFFVLCLVFIFFGAMSPPEDILRVLMGWGLLAWFAISLGFIIGSLTEMTEMFERIWHALTYLMFPLSGAVFMVDWLPAKAQEVILWVPMVHATEMVRHGFFGDIIRTYENPNYLIIVNLTLMFIGLILVRIVAKKVEPE